MDGIFGTLFDLDGNGILSPEEHALEFVMLDSLISKADDPFAQDDPDEAYDPFAEDAPEDEW